TAEPVDNEEARSDPAPRPATESAAQPATAAAQPATAATVAATVAGEPVLSAETPAGNADAVQEVPASAEPVRPIETPEEDVRTAQQAAMVEPATAAVATASDVTPPLPRPRPKRLERAPAQRTASAP